MARTTQGTLRHLMAEGMRCHYCGGVAAEWDHIVPVRLGGLNFPANKTPACHNCNRAKGGRMPSCACGTCRGAVLLAVELGPEMHQLVYAAWLGALPGVALAVAA